MTIPLLTGQLLLTIKDLLHRIVKILSLPIGILCWLLLVYYHTAKNVAAGVFEHLEVMPYDLTYNLLSIGFYIGNTAYLFYRFEKNEKFDVVNILWKLFSFGIMGLATILFLIIGGKYIEQKTHFASYINAIFYNMALYIALLYFLSAMFTFRRFILYQKNRRKVISWNIFQAFAIIMLIFTVNPFEIHPSGQVMSLYFGLFSILCIYLSADIGWTSHLNVNQKLKTLGIFVVLILITIAYAWVISELTKLFDFYRKDENYDLYYIIAIFSTIYSGFSVLVLFSNLPASSVFEAQSNVISSFNKINQAILTNLEAPEIMNTLLSGAILTADADAGWITITAPETEEKLFIKWIQGITRHEIEDFMPQQELTHVVLTDRQPYVVKNLAKSRILGRSTIKHKSLLCVPICSNKNNYGSLTLLKEYTDAFEESVIDSVANLADQTGAALEHAAIIKKSIEFERYHEQLKIAKEMQKQLFPKSLPTSDAVELAVSNINAEEIGGDFYDVFTPNKQIVRIALGDVSGHGTTAAFYMAEVKGLFHVLAQMNISAQEFIINANNALSRCLQKGLFMTLTYLDINIEQQQFTLLRAGHCPSILYHAATDTTEMLREGVPGLGILREGNYEKLVPKDRPHDFAAGDFLVLFTDGITESKNTNREEFGYERLLATVEKNRFEKAQVLSQSILTAVQAFSGREIGEDDCTVMVIKFK